MSRRLHLLRGAAWAALVVLAPPVAYPADVVEAPLGEAVERHLPAEGEATIWAHDPELLETEAGDRLEEREVVSPAVETVKLTGVVPPIHFESGVAQIPPSTVGRLRAKLDEMKHLDNVRLHLVGHADSQPLSNALAGVFGDNAGLSRERAGEVAEFLQTALALSPEAISFEWAGDTRPIASNLTEAGRARNRRVEVEVWYDRLGEKTGLDEVVVPEELKRIKVCRIETVCMLRYREGHEHRARVRNLVAPLPFGEQTVGVPDEFVQQIADTLQSLGDKRGVVVKFVGHTDDAPLTGRAERIYGTHLALSKARAQRVARAVQDALDLPTAAVASDGEGAARPVASNETPRGRALNRRVEVEFWHDDPLQELPEGPQPCPDAAGDEWVTRVYDPPWGRLAPMPVEDGDPRLPSGLTEDLRRALADVADRRNPRVRFVGYTANERLDRRTASIYGDDVGLSTSRARRALERVQAELGLTDAQVEHEGRGYVHARDVVNAGFVQGETSHVVAEVVYDERAPLDDYEGVEITPLTRELTPEPPLALNLMRITVDGEPIDDPARSSADVQRCTDVALEAADIRFRFDGLESEPRLSVTASPSAVPLGPAGPRGPGAATVRFRMYTNYAHFLERAEIRIFDRGQSLRDEPRAVVEVGENGLAAWQAAPSRMDGPIRQLEFVLRAYDEEGRFDETAPQPLWLVRDGASDPALTASGFSAPAGGDAATPQPAAPGRDALLAGYGESGLAVRNIPLGGTGSVRVDGKGIPPGHTVWLAGAPVPVDEQGRFVAEAVLPSGTHTVEVAVLDEEGNGELFLRDLDLGRSEWFYAGMADLTLELDRISGPMDELLGDDARYDDDGFADSRLAFYLSGRFDEEWSLTASADTREEPIGDLFSNFMDKSPESLLRRLDPDYHYPTFGDDGTVEEMAPTLGKFYVKLSHLASHALWGNFKVGYQENELALVERGLYGANLRYQSPETTGFGARRLVLDGFAAEPGTVPAREEFRGTGGSLYFLQRQDLLMGSERVRIEVRDKSSGLVTSVVPLAAGKDYDIDYLQGRLMLAEPVSASVSDELLVRSDGLSGNEGWVVVQYEYTPGFDELDALASGGQGHYWINDFVKLGLTANRSDDSGTDSSLYAGDLTLRRSSQSWIKLQAGLSEGLVSSSTRSDDGGFTFVGPGAVGTAAEDSAAAWRVDASVGFSDFFAGREGRLTFYTQGQDAGYSAPGLAATTDTLHFGSTFDMPITEALHLTAKADRRAQDEGLTTQAQEVNLSYRWNANWKLSTGFRHDSREDDSPLVPVTQEEGSRTDSVVQVGYESDGRWSSYGFAQGTLMKSGDRESNNRVGVGGAFRVSDRTQLDGEVSHGDLGPAIKLGTKYQYSQHTDLYLSYLLGDEQIESGLHARRGNLVYGSRTRLSDSASVYMENRYQHGDGGDGLTRAVGMDFSPAENWNFTANWEGGTLIDRQTFAETERQAGGLRVGYGFRDVSLSSAVEFRFDDVEAADGTWSDRTTWLFKNNLKLQMTPDWRLVGKLNHAFSDSSLGDFHDGGFTEGVVGFAYRPVEHDRLNALAKYTYFFNVPTTDQLTLQNTAAQFIQRSHIASLDVTYDLTSFWTVGGKYAYRLGEVSLDREDLDFFDNSAHLLVLRNDFRFLKHWEASFEARTLALPDLDERRSGALVTLYRYLGEHLKIGVGYNFTDFSDDLTDLSYDHQGVFLNVVGTF